MPFSLSPQSDNIFWDGDTIVSLVCIKIEVVDYIHIAKKNLRKSRGLVIFTGFRGPKVQKNNQKKH
jgi:hypothetical protein